MAVKAWMKQIKCPNCKHKFPASVDNMFLDCKGVTEFTMATCPRCNLDVPVDGVPKYLTDHLREEE